MKSFILSLLLLFPFLLFAQNGPDVQHGFAEVSGGKIYYEVAGQGHPLVFIHGGQLDHRMWDEQVQFFSKKFQVIAYDVRGFGSSPAATAPFSHVEDLAALLKHLKVEKGYIVGLSLGGGIAIDFTLAHPEMVDALVPVGPGLSGFRLPPDANDFAELAAMQAGDKEKATDLWLKSGYMAPAMKNSQIAPRIRQLALDNAHANLNNPLFSKDLTLSAADHLPEIKAPMLVLVGDLDVKGIHQICGLLYARVPGAQEIVIRGSGHIVNMEQQQQFDSAVLEFLEKRTPIKMERR